MHQQQTEDLGFVELQSGPGCPRSGRALGASDPKEALEGAPQRGRLRARASGARFHDFAYLLNNFTLFTIAWNPILHRRAPGCRRRQRPSHPIAIRTASLP